MSAIKAFIAEFDPTTDVYAACQLWITRVSELLLEKGQPQHGTSPNSTSDDILDETLRDVGKGIKLPAAVISPLAAFNERAKADIYSRTLESLLKQVLNIPVNHGEAASLLRSWAHIPHDDGEDKAAMIHPMYGSYRMLTLLMLDAPVTAAGVGTIMADGTPVPTFPNISRNQSDMELTEALWNLGELNC